MLMKNRGHIKLAKCIKNYIEDKNNIDNLAMSKMILTVLFWHYMKIKKEQKHQINL